MARESRVSQSTISNLENGKNFDVLEIDFYMKLYGISSEVLFLRLWANGKLTGQELAMQRPIADDYPLFATAVSKPVELRSLVEGLGNEAKQILLAQHEAQKAREA